MNLDPLPKPIQNIFPNRKHNEKIEQYEKWQKKNMVWTKVLVISTIVMSIATFIMAITNVILIVKK